MSSSPSSGSSSGSGSDSDSDERESKRRKLDEGAAEVPAASKPDATVVEPSDSSDSDSGSESEESKKAKKKKEKDKKKKKDKKAKKGKKDKKDKKGKKKKKKDKKDKKDKKGKKGKKDKKKKKDKADCVSQQFGKYGIIKQEDFFNKKPEFLAWAAEVRKENTGSMGQMKLKELFKEYVEDYNTATMPSKKYYNMNVWDQQQSQKRHKHHRGDEMTEAQKSALACFDDEKARKEEMKNQQMKKQEQEVALQANRLRANRQKVEEMRHQEKLKTQMEILQKQGLGEEAAKINRRLNPNLDEYGRPMTARSAVAEKIRREG